MSDKGQNTSGIGENAVKATPFTPERNAEVQREIDGFLQEARNQQEQKEVDSILSEASQQPASNSNGKGQETQPLKAEGNDQSQDNSYGMSM